MINENALVLKCIDKLSDATNNDAFPDYFLGSIHGKEGKDEKAAWIFNNLIANLPDEQAGYFGLPELYLENTDYFLATAILFLFN